jgi:GAF domain-containing protein
MTETVLRSSGQLSKAHCYAELLPQIAAMIESEPDPIANLANASAALYHGLPHVSWAGFYRVRGGELVLGPFQGRPACIRIARGRGVCGAAWATGKTQIVPDVHAFPGHIACDSASRSEIVLPLFHGGAVVGVLDLDSTEPAAFDQLDLQQLEPLARLLAPHLAAL